MTRDSKRFFPPEAIARISRLEVEARGIVEGFLSGQHRSPYFGQSVEFVQHREYVAGDDLRRIDWKAWSKTDRFYIKQFEEDTNLRAWLVVDGSESMQFGSGERTKFEFASTIAACLSYLLLRQQDAVGLVAFDQTVREIVPPQTQRSQLHHLLAAMFGRKPEGKTSMLNVLKRVADDASRRGMIILISDLLVERPGLLEGLRLLRHRGHDVLVFHVLDDQELDFEYSGTTKFEGLEGLDSLLCDPAALREGYLSALNQFLDEVRRGCTRQLVDYQVVRTSSKVDAVLGYYFGHRIGLNPTARK